MTHVVHSRHSLYKVARFYPAKASERWSFFDAHFHRIIKVVDAEYLIDTLLLGLWILEELIGAGVGDKVELTKSQKRLK